MFTFQSVNNEKNTVNRVELLVFEFLCISFQTTFIFNFFFVSFMTDILQASSGNFMKLNKFTVLFCESKCRM